MSEPIMCAAIPRAAMHSWSERRGTCASRASMAVTDSSGITRPVCGMHEIMWDSARSHSERVALELLWRWR